MKLHTNLKLAVLFTASFLTVFAFQNCSSSEDDSQRPSLVDGNVDGQTVGDGDDSFSFNLSGGDAIRYKTGFGFVPEWKYFTLSFENGWITATTTIHESGAAPSAVDLPSSYCDNSALPHCRHLSNIACEGLHCLKSTPILCNESRRLQQNEANSYFSLFSQIEIQERVLAKDEVLIADCDDPNIEYLKKDGEDIPVSLADKACVAEGKFHAIGDTSALVGQMNSTFNSVPAVNGDFCSIFSSYTWQGTSFVYEARSGFVPANLAYSHKVTYANQKAELEYTVPGDATRYCAKDVPVSEIDDFFPSEGLRYKVLKTSVALADAPEALITYSDASYGAGANQKFYLDDATAQTYLGGAILTGADGDKMKAAVDKIIQRAIDFNLSATCL